MKQSQETYLRYLKLGGVLSSYKMIAGRRLDYISDSKKDEKNLFVCCFAFN